MICIRSGLEAIRVKRAYSAVVNAVNTFDSNLSSSLEDMVFSTRQTETAISSAREAASDHYEEATQELSVRLVKEFREHLENEILQKVKIVAQSQAAKRLELNARLKAIVCEHMDGIAQKTTVRGITAGANGVDGEWDDLLSSHFEILDGDIRKLVTVKGNANEALLEELTWGVSREVFEDLCKDSQKQNHEGVDQPYRAELDKKLEIVLEKAIRKANQAHETPHRGETLHPGGSLFPGGERASINRQGVDCSPSQTKATKQLESNERRGAETFDDLHGDHPPAHAGGRQCPSQRTHKPLNSEGVAYREQGKTSLGTNNQVDEAGSQVQPQQAMKHEAGEAKRESMPESNVTRHESSVSAVKWVLLEEEGGALRTTEIAGGVLSAVHEDQVVNVLTIVGAARHGKSFLMNALTGSDNIFPVSPEPFPCTAGADLSPTLMSLPALKQGGVGVDTSSSCQPNPTIVFVDMEGQGDKAPEHDVRLATPFLLVSKVVIYNWAGMPNKTTILQQLVVMVKAAEKVTPKDEHEDTFGHLILVFRDVTGKAAEIEALVLGEEDTGKLGFAEQIHVSDRNRVRQALKSAFRSVTVHTMPKPHPNIRDRAVALSDVVPEFATSVDQLRSILSEHLRTPHTFGGVDIAGGGRLHAIVGGLCIAVDSTQNISPPSVLEVIDTARAIQAIQQGLVHFDSMLASVFGDELVLSVSETGTTIGGARENAFGTFHDMTKGLPDHIIIARRQELETAISQKADVVAHNQKERRHELDSRMHKLVCEHEEDLAEEVSTISSWVRCLETNVRTFGPAVGPPTVKALENNIHTVMGTRGDYEAKALPVPMDGKVLDERWSEIVSAHFRILEKHISAMLTANGVVSEALRGDLRWAISRPEFDELVKRTLDSLRQLNAIAAAGQNDHEAREKVEEQMKQLTEQARAFNEEGKRALEKSKQAQLAAARAQAHAFQEARQAQERAKTDRWAREEVERGMSQLVKEVDALKKQREAAIAETKRVNQALAQAQARASREAQQTRQHAALPSFYPKDCDSPYALSAALSGAGSKLVVVNFHATWCPPSREATVLMELMSADFTHAVFLNVDVDENSESTAAYGIEAFPTIKFVKNRRVIETVVGGCEAQIVGAARRHYFWA